MATSPYSYATGKRKTSTARVFLHPNGSGKFTVNKKPVQDYFQAFFLPMATESLRKTSTETSVDIYCTVKGGGMTGQAEAIRHGIARALALYNRDKFRPTLKASGLLTRDDRMVERKRFGLRKARKKEQYSKR